MTGVDEAKLPLGLALAIRFVRFTTAVSVFMMVVASVATLSFLVAGSFSKDPVESLTVSLLAMTATAFLVVMVAGGHLLDATLSGRAFSWPNGDEGHPSKKIFLPIVGGIAVHGAAAVILWLPSMGDVAVTWLWPVVWTVIGLGALYLFRFLKAKLP